MPTLGTHPLCGPPTISVGTIHGGISVNTVPDECVIEIDRRILPGDDPRIAYEHVVRWVEDHAYDPGVILHEPPLMDSCGLSDKNNGALAERLTRSVRALTPRGGKTIGVSYGTDARGLRTFGSDSRLWTRLDCPSAYNRRVGFPLTNSTSRAISCII